MDFDRLLQTVVDADASDLILKPGGQPAMKASGKVLFLSDAALTDDEIDAVLKRIGSDEARRRIAEHGESDFAWEHPTLGRLRVNAFRQSGRVSVVMRQVKRAVPGFADLQLPEKQFQQLASLERGLILVTGVTGSGKSTTVASLIEHVNNTRNKHIVTLEDPIEFRFTDNLSIINQREVGVDTRSFVTGLRAAMREAPDVIMLGEIRDHETMSAAIAAAETGHLVISTLHTVNAMQTVERVMTFFPPHQHELIRFQMSTALAGVASQRLIPCLDSARMAPAVELLLATPRTRELLREGKTKELEKALVEGAEYWGTQTFNMSLKSHIDAGRISVDDALAASDNPDDLKLALRGVTKGVAGKLAITR
ncbi:MAG TPA: PilT/PilU family type 4a pilus ATPase [Planctomycetota bacterium]|nr:PilT/PilU family type 4a pilus ATPase [Planctomycetota bacterium]